MNSQTPEVTQNIRYDSIKIPKVIRTKEGYIRGDIAVSRCGVLKYRNRDGSIRAEH
ncbi:MAG: hypothetical protein ACRYE9_00210 [Janthinobacterium lividum]